jgi:iron-sulfur cluster repair protein YtfE (RIC family)
MANTTTDHQAIRKWVEDRGGSPARVKRTGSGDDPGILRIDFPGFSGKQSLESIEWDAFFDWFDKNELAFIYQDRTRGGQPSRFNKLVSRQGVEERAGGRGRGAKAQASSGRSRAGRDEAREESGAETAGAEDAISLLTAQHRQVEELLDQLTQLGPTTAEFRRTFEDLADALAIHSTIEEKIFYPSVKTGATEDLLEESVDDHLLVKRVLATMLESAPDGDLLAELDELGGLTEEHLIEEEHELFPKVRKQMSAEALRELGAQMNDLVEELRREGAPRMHVPQETDAPAPI